MVKQVTIVTILFCGQNKRARKLQFYNCDNVVFWTRLFYGPTNRLEAFGVESPLEAPLEAPVDYHAGTPLPFTGLTLPFMIDSLQYIMPQLTRGIVAPCWRTWDSVHSRAYACVSSPVSWRS